MGKILNPPFKCCSGESETEREEYRQETMLKKPEINDTKIIKYLENIYGLRVDKIVFLPLGADFNTFVYHVVAEGKKDYFLKLRQGDFFDASVTVPKYLNTLGLQEVIPPIETKLGHLWTNLGSFKVILYPYINGRNGGETKLSDPQWVQFGAIMKNLHSADIPKSITNSIPKEEFSSKWLGVVQDFLVRIEGEDFSEPIASKMALFLKSKSALISRLIMRTQELEFSLQKQSLDYILCHADIHGWNLLMDKKEGLYLVDWDTLIFSPKERDLMFVGAGIHDTGRTQVEEEELFYQGYGGTEINQDAITYYRLVRIIQDIGEYCTQIFLSHEGGEDRKQSLEYLQSNFLSNGTIERACAGDKIMCIKKKI